MINLLFKGRKVIRIRVNRRRERVPESRSGGKETITIPLNTWVAQFHTVSVRSYSLACATRSWKWLWYPTTNFGRAVIIVIAVEERERGYLSAEREGIKGICKILVVDKTDGF